MEGIASYPIPLPIYRGFKHDTVNFNIDTVGASAASLQLPLKTGTAYIIEEVDVFSDGTMKADAYMHLNSAASDDAGTRFAERYYNAGTFMVIEGHANGNIGQDLTAAPYIFVTAGTGSSPQNIKGTVSYYYK